MLGCVGFEALCDLAGLVLRLSLDAVRILYGWFCLDGLGLSGWVWAFCFDAGLVAVCLYGGAHLVWLTNLRV